MKLFQYRFYEDFGKEHMFFFFTGNKFTLLQVSIGWDDYKSWPYLGIVLGSNSILDILFYVYRFSFNMQLFARTWTYYIHKVGLTDDET